MTFEVVFVIQLSADLILLINLKNDYKYIILLQK